MNFRFFLPLFALLALVGCKSLSSPSVTTWPEVDALPDQVPADLDRKAPTSVLRRGSDGFVYVVGGVSNDAAPGSPFLARYSGDWPLEDLPRPPLAAGRLVRHLDDDVALVTLDYVFPEAEIEGLEITWEKPDTMEDVGKGLGRVTKLRPTKDSDLEIDIGQELGAQPGDIYGIVQPALDPDEPYELQLARRLVGVCLVDAVAESSATCRLWRGSSMVPGTRPVAVGQQAVFLEHTFGREPRRARIQIAQIEGDDGSVRAILQKNFEAYVQSLPFAKTEIELVDASPDATALDFHRVEEQLEYSGDPQVVVGGSIVDRGGVRHLVVNYSGVGPATGPGMVAAPPEGGVDLGPLDKLDAGLLRSFAGVVWGGALVYRGQTSEALMHLHLLLGDPALQGPLRWHARDQYAMRWAALGFVEQSLWLVLEDEAVARKRNDEQAYLNALGTRVRLLSLLEQPEQALAAAKEYLELRRKDRPNSGYLFALGMYVEMLLEAGRIDEASQALAEFGELCPEGCDGDLSVVLSGVYWSVPEEEVELQDAVLSDIIEITRGAPGPRLAATRTYQGLSALRDERLEDALIAFLEAERLYAEANYTPGVARAKYFIFLTQLSRQELQKAFEVAVDVIDLYRELRDFESVARTYERLAALYTNFDPSDQPGPYLGAGREVMLASVQAQLARGDYAKASEAFFALGTFLLRIGELAESQASFQRSVLHAIRSTRFDVAAMSHLSLGVIARHQNNRETFMDEINRARIMAEIAGEESVMEAIERVLSPPDDSEGDVPTQLL